MDCILRILHFELGDATVERRSSYLPVLHLDWNLEWGVSAGVRLILSCELGTGTRASG
jgi:hypothetical protein